MTLADISKSSSLLPALCSATPMLVGVRYRLSEHSQVYVDAASLLDPGLPSADWRSR